MIKYYYYLGFKNLRLGLRSQGRVCFNLIDDPHSDFWVCVFKAAQRNASAVYRASFKIFFIFFRGSFVFSVLSYYMYDTRPVGGVFQFRKEDSCTAFRERREDFINTVQGLEEGAQHDWVFVKSPAVQLWFSGTPLVGGVLGTLTGHQVLPDDEGLCVNWFQMGNVTYILLLFQTCTLRPA